MPKYVLGLHIGHDSAAALFSDGELVFAEEEERNSRNKNHFGSPLKSIDNALEWVGGNDSDVVAVGIGWDIPTLLKSRQYYLDSLAPTDWAKMKIGRVSAIQSEIRDIETRFSAANTRLFAHHLSHSNSNLAFMSQASEDGVASLVMDAVGEFDSVSAYRSTKDRLPLLKWGLCSSLGYFYQRWAELAGFEGRQACGYLMSLSGYGNRMKYFSEIRNHCITTSPEGLACVDPRKFDPKMGSGSQASRCFERSLISNLTEMGAFDSLESRSDLAAAVQSILEEITLDICAWLKRESKCSALSVSGGVFMNCQLVSTIRRSGIFSTVYSGPAAKDCGISVGAGYLAAMEVSPINKISTPRSPFLGGAVVREDPIWDRLIFNRLAQDCGENWPETVIEDLKKGKIVAIAAGQLEFGPRALGGRSILADPKNASIRDRLNEVKSREKFQPIAASMTKEAALSLFGVSEPEPYMGCTYQAQRNAKHLLPGVLHIDNGCRVHVVNDDKTPLGKILYRMEEPSVLANTSFNDRGEPLPRTSKEALQVYSNLNVDVLYGTSVRVEIPQDQREKLREYIEP